MIDYIAIFLFRLCEEAGLDGFFTNHSLRATAATRMYTSGLEEQKVCEVTGHKSNAVRAYKRTTDDQHKVRSKVINAGELMKPSSTTTTTTTATAESKTINININIS